MKDVYVSIDRIMGRIHEPIHVNPEDYKNEDGYLIQVKGNEPDTADIIVTILIK